MHIDIEEISSLEKPKLDMRNLAPENFEVIGDRYLLEFIEFQELIDLGGPVPIMLADDGNQSQGWRPGRVVAKGNGHRLERDEQLPMFLNVGDIVFYERFSGRYMDIGGKKYVLVNQTAILSKVNNVG